MAEPYASPLGTLWLEGNGRALTAIWFEQPSVVAGGAVPDEAARQLDEYFAGERIEFDVPLAPSGTPFQREVWAALSTIPFGTTITYGRLAELVGRPTGSRAVGAANGQNPLPVVVPCHRVIGADGSLTGYGGGLERKRWLLVHEGALLA